MPGTSQEIQGVIQWDGKGNYTQNADVTLAGKIGTICGVKAEVRRTCSPAFRAGARPERLSGLAWCVCAATATHGEWDAATFVIGQIIVSYDQ